VFKFVSKGDSHNFESAIFYNGQKICTLYSNKYSDGSVEVLVQDGSGDLMIEWEDYLENVE